MHTISTHKDDYCSQITLGSHETERRALMTQRKGKRSWSVCGRKQNADATYEIRVGRFTNKADALRAAEMFVEFGDY